MSNIPHTVGKPDDLLYFAPRILQHAAAERECGLDLSWFFAALQKPGSPKPGDSELKALREFFQPIWLALRDWDGWSQLDVTSIVLPTAVLTGDVAEYFELWRKSRAIYSYISDWDDDGKLGDAFWDPDSKCYGDVVDWFKLRRDALLAERSEVSVPSEQAWILHAAESRLRAL